MCDLMQYLSLNVFYYIRAAEGTLILRIWHGMAFKNHVILEKKMCTYLSLWINTKQTKKELQPAGGHKLLNYIFITSAPLIKVDLAAGT